MRVTRLVLVSLGAVACAATPVGARTARPPLGGVSHSHRLGVVADRGGVLRTANGGASWRRVLRTGRAVHEVDFPSRRVGFALGARALWRTGDGGATWRRRQRGRALVAVDFLGARRGWAVTQAVGRRRGAVLRTVDGGRHWSALGVRGDSLCRVSRQVGWRASGRRVLRTVDGAATWQRVFSVPTHGARASSTVHCVGRRDAWVLATAGAGAGSEAYALWATRDGGRHWRPELAQFLPTPTAVPRVDSFAGPFDVVSDRVVAVLGTCPACGRGRVSLSLTRDGGRHWLHRRVRVPFGEPSVTFTSRRTGWVATTNGGRTTVVRTRTTGRRWHRLLDR